MKYLIFLSLFICMIQAQNETQKEMIDGAKKMCIKESGIDPEVLIKARNGEDIQDPKLPKFTLCFLKKLMLVDDKGNFNKNVAMSIADEAEKTIVSDSIDACLAKVGNKIDISSAWNFSKCYYAKYPQSKV